MRRAAVIVLLVIGAFLAPFAIIGLWTQVVLLDTERFVDLADDLLDREDVRDAIGAEIAEQVVDREPAAAPAEGLIATSASEATNTEAFRLAFRVSLADLHQQLERGDDTLVLDLTAAVEPLRAQLESIEPTVAGLIPSDIGSFTIASRDDQPILWSIVELADRLSIGAIVGVIVAFGLAVALAEGRWRMLGVSGVIVVAWALLLVIAMPLLRNGVTDEIPDETIRAGARGAWVVVTRSLQVEALIAALVGVIAAGVGFVVDLANSRRRGAAPAASST